MRKVSSLPDPDRKCIPLAPSASVFVLPRSRYSTLFLSLSSLNAFLHFYLLYRPISSFIPLYRLPRFYSSPWFFFLRVLQSAIPFLYPLCSSSLFSSASSFLTLDHAVVNFSRILFVLFISTVSFLSFSSFRVTLFSLRHFPRSFSLFYIFLTLSLCSLFLAAMMYVRCSLQERIFRRRKRLCRTSLFLRRIRAPWSTNRVDRLGRII